MKITLFYTLGHYADSVLSNREQKDKLQIKAKNSAFLPDIQFYYTLKANGVQIKPPASKRQIEKLTILSCFPLLLAISSL
jgi:hypothetical protein